MKQFVERMRRHANEMAGVVRGVRSNRRLLGAPVDPRVTYPCYKSLDELIDVDRLQSLDDYLQRRIQEHARSAETRAFDTGDSKMRLFDRRRGTGRVIQLTVKEGADYFDVGNPDMWRPSPHAEQFGPLMDFIATLPFQATARMIIMFDETGAPVTPHRDHSATNVCHEFIWLRTNTGKPFFLTDNRRRRRVYVDGYSAWFDTVNQYHGADATGQFCFSIRVDGVFDDAFRARIPRPSCNPACAAALWACSE